MLNVGVLGYGAVEYYAGEVATSAEDYYAGRGENHGRWVGSLAAEMGLHGEVDLDDFRAVLAGKDPRSGRFLISAQGNASRAAERRPTEDQPAGRLPETVNVLRAASYVNVSAQYVRMLLGEGEAYRRRIEQAQLDEAVVPPGAYLLGVRLPREGTGGMEWHIERAELERFCESRRQTKARPGYDLTLRPPKSVSVLWALTDADCRQEIRDAHTEAVDEVVRYYEQAAVRARGVRGRRHLLETAGIVAAAFDHRTSRAGDPLLHTHVVTANFTKVLRDGEEIEWRALTSLPLFEHAKAAGHLYQAHLRHLLASRLGVGFTPVVNGHAEIIGIPDAVIDAFSKRRDEIAEMLSEAGASSARAAQVATLETRQAKDYNVDADTLRDQWIQEADDAGFGPTQVVACLDRTTPVPLEAAAIGPLFDTMAGAHGLTERAATFHRSDVIETVASAAGASLTAREIEALADQFCSSDRVLLVDRAPVQTPRADNTPAPSSARRSTTQHTYTTPEIAKLEAKLLAWGTQTQPVAPVVPATLLEATLAARPELSPEQRAMVRAVCTDGEFCQPIAGRPGAGKTYATEAVVAAHVAAGIPILGCAVSAAAAAELERLAGFARSTGSDASTVARLLLELGGERGGLRPGTVIVVDEASMIATRDLARLAAAARAAGGAIKLVGDPDQHGSVDVGGVFRRLCAERGDGLVALVDNNRQDDETERMAIDDYREGRVAEALARYDLDGKIVRSATAGESFDAIVADWYAARLCGNTDPMVAGPNSTRRALNDRARVLLKASGELDGHALTVAGREFMAGDQVVARRNDRTLRARGSREFVKNGSVGTVHAIHDEPGELTVTFDREGIVRVPRAYLLAGRLEHGYARTTYGVQGTTHELSHYHPTDVSSFEEGYVALTRARQRTRVYLVDGTLPSLDDETGHAPPEPGRVGLADITAALSRRRAGAMAADATPDLAAVAATMTGRSLAELSTRRRQLDRVLADAPPSTLHILEETRAALDANRARRQAWTATTDQARRAVAEHASDPAHRARAERTITRSKSALGHLERAEARLERRYATAHRQETAHRDWLDEHADAVTERRLVARAEHNRETQIRTAATHDPSTEIIAVLGEEPPMQRERVAWCRAVERIAVYHARHGSEAAAHGSVHDRLLGPRPAGGAAIADYLDATTAIDEAVHIAAEAPTVAAVEL